MKIIFLTFFIFFGLNANARCLNWISEAELAKAKAGEPDAGAVACKRNCFCWDGRDLRKVKVGFVSPAVIDTVDCDDSDHCSQLATEGKISCQDEETAKWDDKANWPGLDFAGEIPPRPSNGWFLWCQRKGLVVDPDGVAAADAEDAAKAQERADRQTKGSNRKDAIMACARLKSAPNDAQLWACLQALARETVREDLGVDDL